MTFNEALTAAVNSFTLEGFDDPLRLTHWLKRLRETAQAEMPTPKVIESRTKQALESVYKRAISPAAVKRTHREIPRFTVERIKPELRAELTRRVLASADLIKLNR